MAVDAISFHLEDHFSRVLLLLLSFPEEFDDVDTSLSSSSSSSLVVVVVAALAFLFSLKPLSRASFKAFSNSSLSNIDFVETPYDWSSLFISDAFISDKESSGDSAYHSNDDAAVFPFRPKVDVVIADRG